MHFRKTGTLLRSAPPLRFPPGFNSADLDELAHDVERTINMFYQCAAVGEIDWKSKGIKRREWRIRLRSNNPRTWFEGPLKEVFERVRAAQASDRADRVRSFVLEAPGDSAGGGKGVFRVYSDEIGTARRLSTAEIRPRASVAVYWPSSPDLPNKPIPGKVIRVDASKRQADVRTTSGRTDSELSGVPFKAIFEPRFLLSNAEDKG
jgi:hypothetical protein